MSGPFEELRPALQSTLRDLSLQSTGAQEDKLLAYLALLQRWNATYNLTSVREPSQMLVQHLADCLAVINPLVRQCGSGPFRLLDVGSGGGLPGAVFALMLPMAEVSCVDAVGKKAAFLRQVAGELRLDNMQVHHARVEDMKIPPFDVISSRAFASLADFTRLTLKLLAPSGIWLAMKGKIPGLEQQQLTAEIDVFHVEQITVPKLPGERCVVWMRLAAP